MKNIFKFAVIAALTITAFASCKKEDSYSNYYVLNGTKTEIISCTLEDQGNGDYTFRFNGANGLTIYVDFNMTKHVGKTIDLSKYDTEDSYYEWCIYDYDEDYIDFYGGSTGTLCDSGTLYIKENKALSSYKVTIKNMKGVYDGKDVTFELQYDGGMTLM